MINRVNTKVAVLFGGPSQEAEISRKSADAVILGLNRLGYHVDPLECLQPLEQLRESNPDVVFILIHGVMGEDGQVQEICKELELPYIGSGSEACQNTFDKLLTKQILQKHGFPIIPYSLGNKDLTLDQTSFSLPYIVKPTQEGSSIGIQLVEEESEWAEIFEQMNEQYSEWLVEPFLSGREFTVSILQDQALPVVEIIPESTFYDYHSKYFSNKTEYHVPASIPDSLKMKLQEMALDVNQLMRCRDLSRIDFIFYDEEVYVLEVNTLPGFTEKSLLPKAAASVGISFDQLCDRLVQGALRRGSK